MRFIFIINDIYALDPSYQYTYFGDDQVNFIDFKLQDIDAEQNLLINFSNKNKKKDNDSDDSISEKNNNNNGKQIFNFEDDDKNSESADDDEKENEKDESIDIENNNIIENYVEIPNIIEISNRNKTENNISKDYTKKNGEEKKIEILNTARASLKTSKLKLNQNTIEQIKKKKEMEEQQLIELRKSLKKGRRYTFPLVPNYPDIISSIPKEEETKNNFEFKKTDSDDSNSTNTGKEDPKENPSKEALNPVVLNQSESSSRRSSNASQEAMFANIKKNLKKINRKNTIA